MRVRPRSPRRCARWSTASRRQRFCRALFRPGHRRPQGDHADPGQRAPPHRGRRQPHRRCHRPKPDRHLREIPCEVTGDGGLTVAARHLHDIIKSLPGDRLARQVFDCTQGILYVGKTTKVSQLGQLWVHHERYPSVGRALGRALGRRFSRTSRLGWDRCRLGATDPRRPRPWAARAGHAAGG